MRRRSPARSRAPARMASPPPKQARAEKNIQKIRARLTPRPASWPVPRWIVLPMAGAARLMRGAAVEGTAAAHQARSRHRASAGSCRAPPSGHERRVGQAVDHRAGNASASRRFDPLPLGRVAKIWSIIAHSIARWLDARRSVTKRGSFTHSGWPSTPQLREETIVTGGDDQGTGLRLERLERDDAIAAGAMALGHGAGRTEARVVPLEPGQPRLEQRGVDDTAAPVRSRTAQRAERSHRGTSRCQ